MQSRRDALKLGLAGVGGALPGVTLLATAPAADAATTSHWRAGLEGSRRADLGDGSYRNPILSGDRPDPNLLKDGADYYATFSSFDYYPGAVIWHSRDLVNWVPIGPALRTPIGSIWAMDIAKHDGRYFIYLPVFDAAFPTPRNGLPTKTYVIHADSMTGPWSEPIDMGIDGYIDPGHVLGEDGKRYLFLNAGNRVRISDDGLRRDGPVEQVYDGWAIPPDWAIEAFALEGPKILRHGGYFYLFSGEGGTAGPPTSHMVVVARSKSIHGPWENCPHNPIVHTASIREPWWSRGHATPVEGPNGDWWMVYHAYENGFRTLGRQMLLEPFHWSADGWPIAMGGDLSRSLAKPRGGRDIGSGITLSGPLDAVSLGSRLAFFAPKGDYLSRIRFDDGALILKGQGKDVAESAPLALIAGDRSYEVTVDVDLDGAGQAGLLLFYNDKLFCGLGAEAGRLVAYKGGREQDYPPPGPGEGRHFSLRVVNDENVASFFVRSGDKPWRRAISFEVSGYNHNMAGGFLSLRPALFASGEGEATFRDLTYRAR